MPMCSCRSSGRTEMAPCAAGGASVALLCANGRGVGRHVQRVATGTNEGTVDEGPAKPSDRIPEGGTWEKTVVAPWRPCLTVGR